MSLGALRGDDALPLFHMIVMGVAPLPTGDAALDWLAEHMAAYRDAHTPEACALLARRCDAAARGADVEVAEVYRRLARLARWRASALERAG